MIFDDEKLIHLIKDEPKGSELKIFYFIAHNQPKDGIRGYKTTKLQLQIDLNLNRRTVFKALAWLKDNALINEIRLVEDSDFMANPYFVMNNADRDARIAEWNRRLDIDSARKIRLRKQKRLRELKKLNQQ